MIHFKGENFRGSELFSKNFRLEISVIFSLKDIFDNFTRLFVWESLLVIFYFLTNFDQYSCVPCIEKY